MAANDLPPPPAPNDPPAPPPPPPYRYRASLTDDELLAQCEAEAFRSSGPGGQHVNTTDSAVRLTHQPTGLVVVSRTARSQFRNRQLCLERLRAQLAAREERPKTRRPTRPSRAAKQRRLDGKTSRSQVKRLRRKPGEDAG